MENFIEDLKKEFKSYSNKHEESFRKMSIKSGLNENCISEIMRGKSKNPSLETIYKSLKGIEKKLEYSFKKDSSDLKP